MDFKQLTSFVSVVKYGNFTAAANSLNISQPTVSTHVQALEEELGRQLMLRTAKHVRLTAYGAKVYEQAQAMLAMHDRMMQSAMYSGDVIYLGASSIPAGYILPEALLDYRKSNPEPCFSIKQGSSQEIADGVFDGMFDVGFSGLKVKDDSISCMPFCSDRIVLITPNVEPYASMDPKQPVNLAEFLQDKSVILREGGSGTRAEVDRILSELKVNAEALNVVASLNDQGSIKNLVEHGFGVSFASARSIRERLKVGRLLSFEIAGAETARSFYILRRRTAKLSEAAEDFIAFMRLRHVSDL